MEHKQITIGSDKYHVRTMNKEEFPQVMDLLKKLEWPIGMNTPYTWYEFDPHGWIVAVHNITNEVLGMLVLIQVRDDLYCADYYAVKEEYREMGIGKEMCTVGEDYINANPVCLFSPVEMMDVYRIKRGYSLLTTDLIIGYTTHNKIETDNLSSEIPEGVNIVSFEEFHLEDILKYDPLRNARNPRRQRMLELNCKEKESKTLVAFENGACVGFGTMKMSILNIPYLAPMYADDKEIAEAMLKRLLELFPFHKGLTFYTYAANTGAKYLMEKIKCPKVSEWYQMGSKKDCTPRKMPSLHKHYAIYEFDFASI